MLDVSWGELIVVTGLGFALVGKKDLPKAAGMVGNRIGRITGLLQGARARADSFAQQTELKQLHNELKSGLRELDAVKSEMAVAMSSRGMQRIGSATMSSSSRTVVASQQQQPITGPTMTASPLSAAAVGPLSIPTTDPPSQSSFAATAQQIPTGEQSSVLDLPPQSQTIAAVAEEEWEKQGIAFRSRAERGVGLGYSDEDANNPLNSGSSILSNIYKQNLIFDQYDRVVQEQDSILQSKIDTMQAKRKQENSDKQS